MFDKLVVVTQTIGIQDTVFIQNNGVVQAAPTSIAVGTQILHLVHKAEGARTTNPLYVGIGGKIHLHLIDHTLENRVIEGDGEIDLETVVRLKAHPFIAINDFHGFFNAYEFLTGRLLDYAGLTQ